MSLLLDSVPLTVAGFALTTLAVPRVLLLSTSFTVVPPPPPPPPPAAAVTAAAALTMPVPHCEQVAGKARAVLFSRLSTWSGVSAGFFASISAAAAATCGAAIDVPWYQA